MTDVEVVVKPKIPWLNRYDLQLVLAKLVQEKKAHLKKDIGLKWDAVATGIASSENFREFRAISASGLKKTMV